VKTDLTRALWVVAAIMVAALVLYFAFSGAGGRARQQDEFPSDEPPPST